MVFSRRSKHGKRSTRHRKRSTRHRRGGASGAEYMLATVGDGTTQFHNSLTVLPGMNSGTVQSNDIVPIANLNISNPISQMPSAGQLSLIQSGGRRCQAKGKGRKGKRGGSFGSVIGQAVVPFSLLAMQQYTGSRRRKHNRKSSRKSRKSRR
jgi:hypothetical protein